MSRLLYLPEALRDAGLEVIEYRGGDAGEDWETHGRAAMQPGGVVWHHTATSRRWLDWHVAQLLYKGRRDLAGPLTQCGVQRDGAWWVIASGVANHAGAGGWRGLEGNYTVVGVEFFNAGDGEPWTDEQYQSGVIGTAAILRRIRRDAGWLCGHKEWAKPKGRKIDPFGIDMHRARRHVAGALQEDIMTPKQEAKLDRALALLEKLEKGEIGGRDVPDDLRRIRNTARLTAKTVGAPANATGGSIQKAGA